MFIRFVNASSSPEGLAATEIPGGWGEREPITKAALPPPQQFCTETDRGVSHIHGIPTVRGKSHKTSVHKLKLWDQKGEPKWIQTWVCLAFKLSASPLDQRWTGLTRILLKLDKLIQYTRRNSSIEGRDWGKRVWREGVKKRKN